MPTEPEILGFGNEWYAPAMMHAIEVALSGGKTIRMVSAPYFLITKLEAFAGRGAGDFQMSHDMEDLIAVVDGRPVIADEVSASDAVLRAALADRFERYSAILDSWMLYPGICRRMRRARHVCRL
jgi:hypothetical protein